MLSMYLSIELQSFGVYILCAIYRNNEYATMQAVKYFLLGGLSSAIILLGTGLIYMDLGLTQFESITCLLSIESGHFPVVLGLILIQVGFIFKVAAAPMHN